MKKRLFGLLMAMVMVFSMTCVAFAAEPVSNVPEASAAEEVQPRIGIAGYTNHYHGGANTGSFTVSTKSIAFPTKQFTIETSGFDSDTTLWVEIKNSKGVVLHDMPYLFTGNNKWENKPLNGIHFINGDTFTVSFRITKNSLPFTDDGWIGVWIY